MSINNTTVDSYLEDGCGRCDKYQTPECKVLQWTSELVALRELLSNTVLNEEMKWGSPTYTLGGKNVVMLGSFRDCCSLSFLKGVALDDPDGILESPGPNSRYARVLRFTSVDQVHAQAERIMSFLHQAIEIERSGQSVEPEGELEPMPEELEERLEADPDLRAAFDALTPGRQRSYRIYVGGAKKSTTREDRVDRCIPKIYAGKGYNEY